MRTFTDSIGCDTSTAAVAAAEPLAAPTAASRLGKTQKYIRHGPSRPRPAASPPLGGGVLEPERLPCFFVSLSLSLSLSLP